MLRWISPIVLGLSLFGCYTPHPRYGADDFSRLEQDVNGIPAYLAVGRLGPNESAEEKVARTLYAACPRGNPRIISTQSMDTTTTVPNASKQRSTSWILRFTCDDVISE
jgi:hypothetical protein